MFSFTSTQKGEKRMLNKCFFMGRLTHDPELRHTQAGTPVASFSLAVERDFKDKTTGERATDFIDVVVWRNTAEFVAKHFSKGRMAVVVGPLQIRQWEDKDGNKRRTAEVIAESVYFGDSKRDSDVGGYAPPDGGFGEQPVKSGEFSELAEDDGELPF